MMNTHYRFFPSVILVAAAASLLPLSVLNAQEMLSPTVVEADRVDAERDADASVSAEEIEKIQAPDLKGIFQKTPSVTVNGGNPMAQQIFVNGLESPLLNITIDGASQGNLFHHAGSVRVEPELLKQVDIYAGAGSALNGPGALGGAIAFETKNAFDFLAGPDDRIGGLSKALYYHNGDGYKLSQTAAFGLGPNWAVLFSGNFTERDAYEDGNGDTEPLTDYKTRNLFLKLSGRFDAGQSLDFSFEHQLSEALGFDRLNVTEDFLNATGRPTGLLQRQELARDTVALTYQLNPESNPFLNAKANVSFSSQDYSRLESDEFAELDTFDITLQNTSRIGDRFESTYGLNFRDISSDVHYLPLAVPRGSEEEQVFGLFMQNTFEIHPMLSLDFGARIDWYDYQDYEGNDFDSSGFSPNVGLTFTPIENLAFSASYAEAYRGVGIREAFISGARPLGLDGEEADTFKISASYDSEHFFASASYFDQSIDNYIYPIAPGRGGPNGSFGDIENDGYEAQVGFRHSGFLFSLGVADNDPSVDGYDYPDDIGMVVAGRRWVADLQYSLPDYGLSFGWNVEYRDEVDEEPFGRFPAVAGKDSYVLHNIYARWDVPQWEGLSLSLNVDNLFDEEYQDHTIYTASGLHSPGRELRFGAAYSF